MGDAAKKPPFYKRPLVLVIGGIVLLAAVGVGVWYWLYSRQYESTDDAFIDAHITAISPKVAGTVLRTSGRAWTTTASSRPDTLLVQIDPRDFDQQVDVRRGGPAGRPAASWHRPRRR